MDAYFNVTKKNYKTFAIQSYRNMIVDEDEFHEDFNKIVNVKKLLNRYHEKKDINIHLLLNHIICFYNVFSPDSATKLLYFYISDHLYPYLTPFLLFLNYLPDVVYGVDGENINISDIKLNEDIIEKLRELNV